MGSLCEGLLDAVIDGDVDALVVGRRFVFPQVSRVARNMIQHCQDAMGICRVKGLPNVFITFIYNPIG